MDAAFKFDRYEFEAWFIKNADDLYALTGIAHYNATNIGLLKLVFMLEQRIAKLEQPKSRKKKNG